MKNLSLYLVKFWILQLLILTVADSAFANSQQTLELDSKQGEFFQIDQNTHAIIFEISGIEYTVDSIEKNKHDALRKNFRLDQTGYLSSKYNAVSIYSDFQLDYKGLLESQIFPFHFFW